jgi:hypothetical protein
VFGLREAVFPPRRIRAMTSVLFVIPPRRPQPRADPIDDVIG